MKLKYSVHAMYMQYVGIGTMYIYIHVRPYINTKTVAINLVEITLALPRRCCANLAEFTHWPSSANLASISPQTARTLVTVAL
jgi:hypothetical protein